MPEIRIAEDGYFDGFVDFYRASGSFRIRLQPLLSPTARPGEHWLRLQFNGPISQLLGVQDQRVLPQNFELKGLWSIPTQPGGERETIYVFEMMGMPEHQTEMYDGFLVGTSMKSFHRLINLEAEQDPTLIPLLNNASQLEHLQVGTMPDGSVILGMDASALPPAT